MKKLVISALTACLAAGLAPGAANAAAKKLCLGTPTVWATGISVSPTSGTVNINSSATVTATVAPTNATTRSVIWSTSNGGVATVSGGGTNNATGTVSANSVGTAYIYAKTNPSATLDGTQFTATYTITVNDPISCPACFPELQSVCNQNFFTYGCSDSGYSGSMFWATGCASPTPSIIYGNAKCPSSVCYCQLCYNGATDCGPWVWINSPCYDVGSQCANFCAIGMKQPNMWGHNSHRTSMCGV